MVKIIRCGNVVARIDIVGKRAKSISGGKSSAFRGGWRVIEYPAPFKGRKEHGVFRTKKLAQKLFKKLKAKYVRKNKC